MPSYLLASCKTWHKPEYESFIATSQASWHWASTPEELTQLASQVKPEYIFFLHWNWKVPASLHENYECVCFHMTDLPYGRGGSPLQNLILAGHSSTKLTALKMVEELDAGPIYLKVDLDLSGSAEEIYLRAGKLCFKLIEQIIQLKPTPITQTGKVTHFTRRTPEQSLLPASNNLEEIYNFIRMLDAPGYPQAFLNYQQVQLKFSQAQLTSTGLTAKVEFNLLPTKKA